MTAEDLADDQGGSPTSPSDLPPRPPTVAVEPEAGGEDADDVLLDGYLPL